jgi:hypothetical protein
MLRLVLIVTVLATLVGCGPKIQLNAEPVAFTGKLTKGGGPIGGVTLTLQPVEVGHPVPMTVGPDGSFSGQAVPGKYVYFVSSNEADAAAIDKVDAKYREADMGRAVVVKSDQKNYDIALD